MIVLSSVALIGMLISLIKRDGLFIPKDKVMLGAGLLPVIYLISSLAAGNSLNSLFGYTFEVGTFVSIFLGVFLMCLIVFFAISPGRIIRLIESFFISGSILIIFALIKIFSGGNWLTLKVLSGNMANPVGSWTDYAVFFAILLLFSAITLQVFKIKGFLNWFLYAVSGLSIFLLIVINFSIVWWLIAALALGLLVYFKRHDGEISKKFLVLFVIALIFALNPTIPTQGIKIGEYISTKFNVQNINVRPGFQATLDVDKSTLHESPILGSGPNTFTENWFLYKQKDLNATSFWNTPFSGGIGFLPTQIASIGIVGSLIWIVFLLFLLSLGFKSLKNTEEPENHYLLLSTFSVTIFLWAIFFLYIPSSTMLFLAFLFSGLLVSSCVVSGSVNMQTPNLTQPKIYIFSIVSVSALVVVVGVLNFYSARTALAFVNFRQAITLSTTAGIPVDTLETKLTQAINYAPTDTYYRSLSDLYISKARAALTIDTGDVKQNTQIFQDSLVSGISAAQKAVSTYPAGYSNWISLGAIYEALVPDPFKVKGAYESANAAFSEAGKRNPLSPEVPYLLGRLEYENGNLDKARQYVNQSIALKQDFADAYFLLTQIELSQNNVKEAIKSAEAGVSLTPGNAGVFFELGLLKYSQGDFRGAGQAFFEALKVIPDYANAKYFLGLSLSKLGDNQNALLLFRDLLISNPDNKELPLIISNIAAGHDPLYKSPSPKPEKRNSAPIPTKST
ncbi:tetratricopeptide repeat protein [Candidatus Parcubacteria bacterium]|nr:tetratricopeptide repeat protein [Candidatus Parcubacteria bacterium]